MDYLKQETTSGTQLNLDGLYQLFPQCFTEARDEVTGKMHRVVNFSALRELLGDDTIEDAPEAYEFTWVGKQAAKREAARPIRKTLRPCPEESVDWENTQNLYIEGDNLEVLKLLQASYMGKVKMIYIDPPYNTGNDFVYRDNFAVSSDEYEQALGNVGDEGERFRKNSESNGRFHSDWCSMMYARLLVARSLLKEDGVIFISIDDNEVRNLKNICDEIFGESNFITFYKWNKTATPPALSHKVRSKYEFVLCYEKNRSSIKYNGGTVEGGDMPLLNESNNIHELTFPKDSIRFNISGTYYPGMYDRVELLDTITVSNGVADKDFRLKSKFKWIQSTLNEEIANGTRFIIKTEKFAVRYMREGERIKRPSDILSKIECNVGTNEDAAKDIEALFGENIMSYPKPVSLIKYLIPFAEIDKNSIVLDFFSGSATTAHAVMQLNAEDGGNRKFIMVQLPEQTSEDSAAYGAGYENICEIGKERIRRAGRKIKEEAGIQGQDLDVGFRVYKCDESNMEDVYFQPKEYKQETLFAMLDNIKPDRTDLDLLFGCMLDWGVELSLPLSKQTVDGCDIHIVNEGDLVACFSENVNEEVIDAIAELDPLRVVFRDSCFDEASSKMNLFELFKQKCNWSEEEAKNNIRVI